MRIALVVHKFPPYSVGGTEIYTLNLARELSRRGYDVYIFYRWDEDSFRKREMAWEERKGFKACRVSRAYRPGSASPLAQFLDTFFNPDVEGFFKRFLEEARPDIIHFQHLMSLSYRLIPQARQRGFPIFLTLHDYWFLCSNSQLVWPDTRVCLGRALGLNCARCALARVRSPLTQPLRPIIAPFFLIRDALVRRSALKADCLIAPSRFLIEQYVRAGFPSERFIYLENGIDVERIQRYPRHPSADGRVRFTYLGALAWQKGVHVVVEAFRGIPAGKAVLRVYGDPNVFPEYAAYLRRLADPTNTFFEGPIPNEEVGHVLAETDVVVVPSLWYENSPLVIQEAMAAGIPVIASDLGALAEKVRPGINGWLCSPGEVQAWRACIQMILEKQSWRQELRMGEIQTMSIEEHVNRLEHIYHFLSPVHRGEC